MTDGAGEIRLRDEILELLYWLEGEGFETHATVDGAARFLAFPVEDIGAALEQLIARGDVSRSIDGALRLTPVGRREAARRFADDFADLLKQGHGECNDPTCDCHENPAGAAECHAHARHDH